MKISELAKQKTLFSAEVFPPKKNINNVNRTLYSTIENIKDINFDFISVTLGAGGNQENIDLSCKFANVIKEYDIEPMIHIPAYVFDKSDVDDMLVRLKNEGVNNILALRGDVPANGNPPKTDFKYASDLTAYIKSKDMGFDISGGCYPEIHPESKDSVTDIINLKKKVDSGADHLISQLFFDNNSFYSFLEKARIAGINVPIEAGIMPVINAAQIKRMVNVCGANLPKKFTRMMDKYGDSPEAIFDCGIAYAVDQIVDLLSHDVDGIHLYIMNNTKVAKRISEAVSSLIR